MYGYEEVKQDLNKISKNNKDKVTLSIIGKSLDNRNIYKIILGNIKSENHFLVHGSIHGREYMTTKLIMDMVKYYLRFYERLEYKKIFEKVAFHIIPLVNPDGVAISQYGLLKIKSKRYEKLIKEIYINDKTNRFTNLDFNKYLTKWKANIRGVDLNRNFNADFKNINGRIKPSSENYKGKTFESEPETKALVKATESYNFKGSISYHSSGRIIYWDYKDSIVRKESSKIADIILQITGYEKALQDSSYKNVVGGGYKDYISSKEENPIPSVTVEIGVGESPLSNYEYEGIFNENYLVFLKIAEYITRNFIFTKKEINEY